MRVVVVNDEKDASELSRRVVKPDLPVARRKR